MPTHKIMDLHALRQRVGGKVYDGGHRWIGPGPGHSRRDESLSVRILDGRVLVHSFSGDDFKLCAQHIGLERAESEEYAEILRRQRERALEERRLVARAWAWCDLTWSEATPIRGTVVDRYLASRGLEGCDSVDMRFHPSAPLDYGGHRFSPAMVCVVRDWTGSPRGIHVTGLTNEGCKIPGKNPRRILGLCGGGAIQLERPKYGEIAVCEGVETALSFSRIHGIPTWSCCSTSGLRMFEPTADISLLHIAPDGDRAGRSAGDALEKRLSNRVGTIMHDIFDHEDWNDQVRRRS